jgi:hypothetical protein
MRHRTFVVGAALLAPFCGCGSNDKYLPAPRVSAEDDATPAAKPAAPNAVDVSAAAESQTPAGVIERVESSAPSSRESSAPADSDRLSAEEIAALNAGSAPDEPLDKAGRRARSVENLSKIAQAVEVYMAKHGAFPAPSRRGRTPLLSWRVQLLPALGYDALYREFRRTEPWDSPHNKQLIGRIPPEFQSPERRDGRTNYLAPSGRTVAFSGSEGVERGSLSDGLADTILVVEADEQQAVPWTRPDDLPFDESAPRRGLGELRGDGFLAALGSGGVVLVPESLDEATVRALFTVAGGEKIAAASVTVDPLAEKSEDVAASPINTPPRVADPPASASSGSVAASPEGAARAPAASAPPAAGSGARLPIPDEAVQQVKRKTLGEIFQTEYKDARTKEDRARLAEKMIGYVPETGADAASRYVLLSTVRDIAAASGDLSLTRRACDQLVAEFDGAVAKNVAAVKTLAGAQEQKPRRELAEWSRSMMDLAYEQDQFIEAKELHGIALSLARVSGERELVRELMQRQTEIETARREFAAVAAALDKLDRTPDDEAASLILGRYLCFIKGFWDRGLPYLALGSDPRLARVAEQELADPGSPQEQLDLADAWWSLAADHPEPFQGAMKQRAGHWYELVSSQLPDGLLRIKAEIRLRELK